MSNDAVPTPPRPFRAILLAGLLAGSFDLLFAFIYYGAHGAKPRRILQSIAGGLLGRATYDDGAASAVLGFFLQYVIASGAAAVYLGLGRLAPRLARATPLAGPGFGAAIYFVMNVIVVPLSAWHSQPWPMRFEFMPFFAHLGIGLIIALVLRRVIGDDSRRRDQSGFDARRLTSP
ncbi:MAG TPA: hypothetical protein VG710_11545 [Opitutus sp.]|nr:hypothetical protein [Opitutus sp.]